MAIGLIAAAGAQAALGYMGMEEQRKASRVQRQISRLRAAQARRQLVMQTQSASSDVAAAGAVTGTLQSSRTQQAVGSAASQAGSEAAYAARASALGDKASQYLENAARYQFYGNLIGAGAGAYNEI